MTVLQIGPKEKALRALREQRAKETMKGVKVVRLKAKGIGKVVSIKGSKRPK